MLNSKPANGLGRLQRSARERWLVDLEGTFVATGVESTKRRRCTPPSLQELRLLSSTSSTPKSSSPSSWPGDVRLINYGGMSCCPGSRLRTRLAMEWRRPDRKERWRALSIFLASAGNAKLMTPGVDADLSGITFVHAGNHYRVPPA